MKKAKNIIKSTVKKPEDVENLLLTNFNIMMNMKVGEDKDLQKIKFEIEERKLIEEKELQRRMFEEQRMREQCERRQYERGPKRMFFGGPRIMGRKVMVFE